MLEHLYDVAFVHCKLRVFRCYEILNADAAIDCCGMAFAAHLVPPLDDVINIGGTIVSTSQPC